MAERDDLLALVPHAGPMMLLARVLQHGADETACAVEIREQELFREADGTVPAWVAVEYMAQCIAVHAGLSRGRGAPAAIGYLASVRGLRLHCERFRADQRLEAIVRRTWGSNTGLASFACRLRDAESGALLAEGQISCFAPAGGPARP